LQVRLQQGMTLEVEKLLAQGVSAEQLILLWFRYKYITLYVTGQISEQQMVDDLYIAICQFANGK
jgi:tRNA dimethylallyltransferase